MGAVKKMALDVELEYLQTALSEGRATIQDVSLKAIGNPDHTYQARVVPLNMDHVKALAAKRDTGTTLDPAVIFRHHKTGKMKMADGFHRHEEARRRGDTFIRAYVIDTHDLEGDALFYCTMCNQKTYLERTPGDIKKALFMLFETEEWFRKSNAMIARHVGVSVPLYVSRARAEFCAAKGVAAPAEVETSAGRTYSRRSGASGPPVAYRGKRGKPGYRGMVHGKQVYLGTDPVAAQSKLETLRDAPREQGRIQLTPHISSFIRDRVLRGGIFCEPPKYPPYLNLGGLVGTGWVLAISHDATAFSLQAAIGRVLILKALCRRNRAIVCGYDFDKYEEIAKTAAEQLGVEFLTPEELVASLTGGASGFPTEPDTPKEGEG